MGQSDSNELSKKTTSNMSLSSVLFGNEMEISATTELRKTAVTVQCCTPLIHCTSGK